MTNVSHSSLTGSQLHEPKGADSASTGTVYVADGAGSGTWQSVGTSAFTGAIADFVAVTPPAGWLELDGSIISTTTYSALYGVLAKQVSGTRSSGSPTITSISDTSPFRVGYYVFGTGIPSGTTILTIDSGTQITLSGNATSSGSAVFAVSPCAMNTGTITLPDFTTSGRYRRTRTSTTAVGQTQTDSIAGHTHTGSVSVTGTTDSQGTHNHTVNDPGHNHNQTVSSGGAQSLHVVFGSGSGVLQGSFERTSVDQAGISLSTAGAHTHNVTGSGSFTTASTGSSETRPVTYIVMTCIKT